MSMTDIIFDLADHLEDTIYEDDFDAVCSYINTLEHKNDKLSEKLRWRDPAVEQPEESDPLNIRRVLVKCEWYDTPVIGWYICGEWKVDGSPSTAPVTGWMPFPV